MLRTESREHSSSHIHDQRKGLNVSTTFIRRKERIEEVIASLTRQFEKKRGPTTKEFYQF